MKLSKVFVNSPAFRALLGVIENSFSQLLFKLNGRKFLVVGLLRLLIDGAGCALEAVCEFASDSYGVGAS